MISEETKNLTCATGCPCRNEDICLRAGLKNGQEFGRKLRRAVNERRQEAEQLKQSKLEN